jgi:hypothetical protein
MSFCVIRAAVPFTDGGGSTATAIAAPELAAARLSAASLGPLLALARPRRIG